MVVERHQSIYSIVASPYLTLFSVLALAKMILVIITA
jgi:hypothetical protein